MNPAQLTFLDAGAVGRTVRVGRLRGPDCEFADFAAAEGLSGPRGTKRGDGEPTNVGKLDRPEEALEVPRCECDRSLPSVDADSGDVRCHKCGRRAVRSR